MTDPIAGYTQGGTYTAEQDRRINNARMHRLNPSSDAHGVIPQPGSMMNVALSSGMNITAAAGYAMVNRYTVNIPTATALTVAPSTSSARRDLVIVRVYDVEAGDATNEAKIELVKGTTTSDPALPARSLVIGQVDIAANASTVVVTDRRTFCPAAGGVQIASAYPTAGAGVSNGVTLGQFVHNFTDRTTKQNVAGVLKDASYAPVAQYVNTGQSGQGQAGGTQYDPCVVTATGIPAARWIEVIAHHQVWPLLDHTIAGFCQLYVAGVFQNQWRYHNASQDGFLTIPMRTFVANNSANPEIRIRNISDSAANGVGTCMNNVWHVSVIAYAQ
jgi:hypothetical protein